MNQTCSLIILIFLAFLNDSTNSSTILTLPDTLNTLNLINQDNQLVRQLKNQQQLTKLPETINLDLSNLNTRNFDLLTALNANNLDLSFLNSSKISVIDPKSLPTLNTADLWRLINNKLRIGSFFSRVNKPNAMESSNCQCAPAATDKMMTAKLIPMPIVPVVERIHHIYDKQIPNSNKLVQLPYKPLSTLEHKQPFNNLKYSTSELKQPLDHSYLLKNVYKLNTNLYDINRAIANEQLIKKDTLDKTRFLDFQNQNDLINGRSINAVRTFNPSINLNEDIYLQNNLPNLPNKEQTNLANNALVNSKLNDELNYQLNNWNNFDRQSSQDNNLIDEGSKWT